MEKYSEDQIPKRVKNFTDIKKELWIFKEELSEMVVNEIGADLTYTI